MRFQELSNFGCRPSRAGGSPFLLERGFEDDIIATMEDWAQWLHKDSIAAGNVMIDTSLHDAGDVFDLIRVCFSQWEGAGHYSIQH